MSPAEQLQHLIAQHKLSGLPAKALRLRTCIACHNWRKEGTECPCVAEKAEKKRIEKECRRQKIAEFEKRTALNEKRKLETKPSTVKTKRRQLMDEAAENALWIRKEREQRLMISGPIAKVMRSEAKKRAAPWEGVGRRD